MAPIDLPYLHIYHSRGRAYGYYRRFGQRWRIRGDVGSAEFLAAYQARHAMAEAPSPAEKPPPAPRSLAELIALYRASPEWRQLKPSSRTDYEKFLAPLEDRYGHCHVATLERRHVRQIRDVYASRPVMRDGKPALDAAGQPVIEATPRRANKTIAVLSILMTHAIELGWRRPGDNPCARPKRLKTGAGYRAWSTEEIATLTTAHPELAPAILLALATGQRSGDLVRLTRRDYDGTAVQLVQEKTGAPVWMPLAAFARGPLDAHLAGHSAVTLLAKPDGTPWRPLEFQTYVSKAIRGAGLPRGVVWHGLRATHLTLAAEGGASERELMATGGHATPSMVSRYTRGADRKRRATAAVEKLQQRWTDENDHK